MNRPRDSMLGPISSAGSVDVPFDNLDRNRSISGRACAKIVIFHCFVDIFRTNRNSMVGSN